MLKKLLFVFILFSIAEANAQEWKPVNRNEKYNYQLATNTYYATIWVDSLKVINNDSIFYLNKIIKKVANGTYGINGYYLNNQSQFFLSKLINTSSGNILMEEDSSIKFLIKPNANLYETWVFDSIKNDTASVIDISTRNIFGFIDSVKTIALSSNDTIVISKNYGIIRFPLFDSLKQHVTLSGIEGRNIGMLTPKESDFFNFNIGDIFYYKYFSYFSNWSLYSYYENYKKIVITNKVITGDSIIYLMDFKSRGIYHVQGGTQNDTTYLNKNDSTIIYTVNDEADDFLNKYNNQILNWPITGWVYKPITLSYDNVFESTTKSYSYYPFCRKYPSDTIIECLNWYLCSFIYETYSFDANFGLRNRVHTDNQDQTSFSETLVGCIRNGITYGTILNDSIFFTEAPAVEADFNIYPNPVTDQLIIENIKSLWQTSLVIYDIHGIEVKKMQLKNSKTAIDVSNLTQGLYLIKFTNHDFVQVKMFVKG
jgi:hypothetical protein